MDQVQEWWGWLVERWNIEDTVLTSDTDYTWWILGVAALVLLATLYKPTWNIVKYSPTFVHEIFHGLAAVITFQKVHGLRVERDESGVLFSSTQKNRKLSRLFVILSGYPGPSVLATMMALLLFYGMAGASLTLYHILLMFGLLLCRNIWGLVSALLAIGLTIGISIWNDPYAVSWTVIVLIIFYSITGIRGSWGLFKVHFSHFNGGIPKPQRIAMKDNRKGSDAYNAWKITLIIPPAVWVFFFIGVNVALTIVNIGLLISWN